MKAVVAAFNQEKALVGAFSVITNLRMDFFEALTAMSTMLMPLRPGRCLPAPAPAAQRTTWPELSTAAVTEADSATLTSSDRGSRADTGAGGAAEEASHLDTGHVSHSWPLVTALHS